MRRGTGHLCGGKAVLPWRRPRPRSGSVPGQLVPGAAPPPTRGWFDAGGSLVPGVPPPRPRGQLVPGSPTAATRNTGLPDYCFRLPTPRYGRRRNGAVALVSGAVESRVTAVAVVQRGNAELTLVPGRQSAAPARTPPNAGNSNAASGRDAGSTRRADGPPASSSLTPPRVSAAGFFTQPSTSIFVTAGRVPGKDASPCGNGTTA